MNKQQKLTALALALSLSASSSALAYSGAPTSQFGFKGWPYRQSSVQTEPSCTPELTGEPVSTPLPMPEAQPTAVPTMEPTVTATPKPVVTAPPSIGDDYTTPSIGTQEAIALNLLNQDRKANGLPALALDPALSEIARAKSRDMHEKGYFSHTSPTYGSPSQMLNHFGYTFTSVGENIAHHANIEKAQAAFMSSSGHRSNILGSQWKKVGIGVWTDHQGFVYVTQLFVR